MKDTLRLNNGVEIPRIGYGVYQIPPAQTASCVKDALQVGYRSIDTAQIYNNEAEVGIAVRSSGLPRSEVFITTKLWGSRDYETTRQSIETSLKRLDLDYIDLLLIHEPSNGYEEVYRAMENALSSGHVRAIGVANFLGNNFDSLLRQCSVKPAVNQIKTHPFRQQSAMLALCKENGIALEAWSPLACGRNHIFTNPVLTQIAQAHGKTVAQVVLRWLYQRDIIVIPKSVHRQRMIENFAILDFSLTQAEMSMIFALDQGKSLFHWW